MLGDGNFGEVFLGELTSNGRKVAIKTCKDTVPDPARFLEEADVLKEYQHPNIVELIGVVSTNPFMIILELAEGGELLSYLRQNTGGAIKVGQLCRMSAEAAEGMR
jgi:serine/threonine protein kinase